VMCALALAFGFCVSPEELRREDEATCSGYGFTPAPTPLLAVSRRKAWHAVIRFRRHLRIGAGVIGAGPGDRTGLSETLGPGALSHLYILGGYPQHDREGGSTPCCTSAFDQHV
jgi:hypothetical protein